VPDATSLPRAALPPSRRRTLWRAGGDDAETAGGAGGANDAAAGAPGVAPGAPCGAPVDCGAGEARCVTGSGSACQPAAGCALARRFDAGDCAAPASFCAPFRGDDFRTCQQAAPPGGGATGPDCLVDVQITGAVETTLRSSARGGTGYRRRAFDLTYGFAGGRDQLTFRWSNENNGREVETTTVNVEFTRDVVNVWGGKCTPATRPFRTVAVPLFEGRKLLVVEGQVACDAPLRRADDGSEVRLTSPFDVAGSTGLTGRPL
jgi:hypothetical protein